MANDSGATRKVVVGYTTTPTAEEATRQAFALAEDMGAELYLVTVIRSAEAEVMGVGTDRYEVETGDLARGAAQRFIDQQKSSVPAKIQVREGDPAKAILAEAERVEADVIVVGNVRMQGLGRVLGSVGSAVVQHAPCNVLVVKTS